LGVYNFATELSTMLTTDMMVYIQRALYSGYAALREDRSMLAEAYLLSLSGTLIIGVAFGAGLYAVREDFVAVLLGPKWLSTIPLIEWLSICAILRSIGVGGALLMVTERERTAALLVFLRLAVVSGFVLAGAEMGGVQGVAIGLTVAFALLVPTSLGIAMGIHGISLQSVLRACWRPVVAGLVMVPVVRTAHLDGLQLPALTLLLDVLTGAIVFVGTILLLWVAVGRPRAIESMLFKAVAARLCAKSW
jgi:PST family polysaccharide transporter